MLGSENTFLVVSEIIFVERRRTFFCEEMVRKWFHGAFSAARLTAVASVCAST